MLDVQCFDVRSSFFNEPLEWVIPFLVNDESCPAVGLAEPWSFQVTYKPSNTVQYSGKDFSTQLSPKIQICGVTRPATAKLMAIR
jgi:hypothetical protein